MTKSSSAERSFSWRVPAIDGLRAMATLMVFMYHTWQFSGSPRIDFGVGALKINALGLLPSFPAGVDLFMVLSGFCLFLPLCKADALKNWRMGNYFMRRVRRIAPPYYAAILYAILLPQILVVLYRALGQQADWQQLPSALQLGTHLVFAHTLFVETWSGINGSLWTLGLEAQFYLVFPIAIWGFVRFGPRFFWVMIGASIAYRVGIVWYHNAIGQPLSGDRAFVVSIFFLGRWMQFALGMAAAWLVSSQWKAERRWSGAQGALMLAMAIVLYLVAVSEPVTQLAAFPARDLLLGTAFAAAILALCASDSAVRAPFENRFLAGLGFISYSVYLVHEPTAWYFSELLKKVIKLDGLPLMFTLWTVGLSLCIAIAYLFFLAVERPFLNTRKEKFASPSPKNVASESTLQDQSVP